MARKLLWWVSAFIFNGLVILISSNSAQWVFLARVQWVALLALTVLPVLAHTCGRELLVGAWLFLDFFVAREILSLLDRAVISALVIHAYADLVKSPVSRLAAILPLWISSGYFRLDGNPLVIEPGHIRAAICFLATTLLYFWHSSYSEILKRATLAFPMENRLPPGSAKLAELLNASESTHRKNGPSLKQR
jgi:hypothetical protein